MVNVAEILKDCPKGTKLYSPIFGDVYFDMVSPTSIISITINKNGKSLEQFLCDGRYTLTGECMIFPSKYQRDWSKFQRPFKDGDILIEEGSFKICIYKGRMSPNSDSVDYYCGYNGSNFVIKEHSYNFFGYVSDKRIATDKEIEKFMHIIQENGYEWNAETKNLQKLSNPVLKVGDIIAVTELGTGVIRNVYKNSYSIIIDNQLETEAFHEDCRLATDEEEKEWMNYLKKIGYIWDKEKNILKPLPEEPPIFIIGDRIQFENGQVVKIRNISNGKYIFDNIKPVAINYVNSHCKLQLFSISELKPFDKVIVRNDNLFDDEWCIDFFSHYKNNKYVGTGNCIYDQCVPYNKETKYLIGTSQEYEGYYKTWYNERS